MKRVVITGIGAMTSIGHNSTEFNAGLKNQKLGISDFDTFDNQKYPIRIGATVKNLQAPKHLARLPRTLQFLILATEEALQMSGVNRDLNPHNIGFFIAGPACAVFESEDFYREYLAHGPHQTNKENLMHMSWDASTNFVAKKFSLLGPRNTVLTACSSSGVAAGMAYDLIRMGDIKAMVVGGTDGFSEFTFSGFNSLQSISPFPCTPFDEGRKGLSFGEGAGIFVLEEYEHAKKRGAHILAELSGYGMVGEAFNLTAPRTDAYGFIKTMSKAMQMGQISPDEISYVNAHGTATPLNDSIEGLAVKTIFNNRPVPVNSIKSLVGHCMGAAGAVEAVNCILSLQDQYIPGTLNCKNPDPQIDINIVRETADAKINYVLCNSAGFGGNNSSLLFKRFV